MKLGKNLNYRNLDNFDYSIILNKEVKKGYYDVVVSFDIETSSYYNDIMKRACCYSFTFCIEKDIIILRTYKDFIEFINNLHFLLKGKMIIWVHNLSYEFQFIRKWIPFESYFFIENRKIVKAIYGNIEFRCSYLLSGYSLSKIAEHLQYFKISKLKGDLNYQLLHTSITPLFKKEIRYIVNDVAIVYGYIREKLMNGENYSTMPLTKTGYVRKELERNCLPRERSKIKEYYDYHEKMKRLTLDKDHYYIFKKTFSGGFTHANAMYVGQVVDNVHSFDKSSAYPSVIVSKKFPMTPYQKVDIKSDDDFYYYIDNYDYYSSIFYVEFEMLESKIDYDYYISASKCETLVNEVDVNGRVFSADTLGIWVTELDFLIIKKSYNWNKMYISHMEISHKQYLPTPFVKCVLDFYYKKTILKGDNEHILEYRQSKENINSIYGSMVTDPVRDIIDIVDNEYTFSDPDIDKVLKKYNSNRRRTTWYAWGLYVTAYVRFDIWDKILTIKNDYCYTDTDSIKCINDHFKLFEDYNKQIEDELKRAMEYHHLDFELCRPKGKTIGYWEYEGSYNNFKTLGAKRYMYYQDDHYELVCAGLPKSAISYILKRGGFEFFKDGLLIPSDNTGKLTHTYIDNEFKEEVTDYLGNDCIVYEKSYIHLEKASFDLSLSNAFINWLFTINNVDDIIYNK